MFVTPELASQITNKVLEEDLLFRAQMVIETYVGKTEVEVSNSFDKGWMGRAIAYQAAYMKDTEDLVYEQVAAKTTAQNDSILSFKDGDDVSPFIAPLAVMACKKLTFMRSRSVETGKMSQRYPEQSWRTI